MSTTARGVLLYAIMAALILAVGLAQGWVVALSILNLCLISAVMSLGVNIQWGYAGLFNAGVMGFAALGGIGVVLTSMPPVKGALSAGGWNLGLAGLFIILTLAAAAAYLVGKVALGLRSDYLAIATLGIAEIILAILKNENWLTRGVKNVTGLPRVSQFSFLRMASTISAMPRVAMAR